MKVIYWILFSTCLLLIIISIFFPPQKESSTELLKNSISIITLVVLLFTLRTYIEISDVSKETLSFTKRQTTFNTYLDNYKLYNELSKKKIGMVYSSDKLYDDHKQPFEILTFDTLYINYKNIIQKYTSLIFNKDKQRDVEGRTPIHLRYKNVFDRYHHKVQSFINILNDEISSIKRDKNLKNEQKAKLIDLYVNFVFLDYYNLCNEIIEETDRHDENPVLLSDILQCVNYADKSDNLDFNIDAFLSLQSNSVLIRIADEWDVDDFNQSI